MAKITMEGLYRIWLKQSKNTKNKNLEALFINWMGHYKQAAAYYKANGHLNVPCTFRTTDGVNYDPKGFALGLWVRDQRSMRNAMRNGKPRYEFIPIKEKLLELIGMDWHPNDIYWNRNLAIATNYYNAYGNLDVPNNFKTKNGVDYDPDGFNLDIWLVQLRNDKKNGRLSKIRILALNKIGMIWDYNEDLWLKNYELAKAFYKAYGHLNVPIGFRTLNGVDYDENGIDLCQWIRGQKAAKHGVGTYAINEKRIKLLDEIGMDWDYTIDKWNQAYAIVLEYFKHHGNLDAPKGFKTLNGIDYDENGIDIYQWVRRQRSNYKVFREDDERRKLLEAIGINGEPLDKWGQNYLLAKAYFEHHGNLNIRIDFRTTNGYDYDPNGKKLGLWIQSQREAYKGKAVFYSKDKKIKMLTDIGMIWFSKNTNDKLLSETIDDTNIERKQAEILSRFYSSIQEYDPNTLPNKDEINSGFIKILKR